MSAIVTLVVYLLVAAVIFGLLWWLVDFVGGQFPSVAPFIKVIRVILVVVAVLLLIYALLGVVSGTLGGGPGGGLNFRL